MSAEGEVARARLWQQQQRARAADAAAREAALTGDAQARARLAARWAAITDRDDAPLPPAPPVVTP